MAIPKKLFNKTWAELDAKQKKNIGVSKSEFIRQKKAHNKSSSTPKPTPKPKRKAAAILAINEDKGKLKPNDVKQISKDTGLSEERIVKLATNSPKVEDKKVSKGALRILEPASNSNSGSNSGLFTEVGNSLGKNEAQEIAEQSGKSLETITQQAADQGIAIGTGTQRLVEQGKSETGTDDDNKVGEGKGGGGDDDYVPEFPKGVSGKDLKKYKTQGKEIREAAEADLARRLKESFAPKKMVKAEKIKTAFKTGRKERKERLSKIEKGVSKPNFKRYKKNVEQIRKGKGPAKEFGYSGKFERLGKSLGIKYGAEARAERTDERITRLRKGIGKPKKAYKTAAESFETQKKKGKNIIKRFKGEM